MNRHFKLGDQHDYSKYERQVLRGASFYVIPFSDLVPADFEDVTIVTKEGEMMAAYYSPAHNHLEVWDGGFQSFDICDCAYWLKPIQ